MPADVDGALAWPAKAEAWSNDHFGWRDTMVDSYARLRHDLFQRFPTNQMMAGRGDRIFLAAHNDRGLGAPYTALIACGWQFDGGARPDPRIHFPLSEVLAMRDRVEFFPKANFHWGASGAGAVAALTERHVWRRGEDAGKPIPLSARMRSSDVDYLFTGIRRESLADEPDFSDTTITPCFGPDCFPEARPVMEKLAVVGRYVNSAPGLGPRLVIFSDSLGHMGAPMFARYHREVVCVSTSALVRLDPDEVAQLRKSMLSRAATTRCCSSIMTPPSCGAG